MNKILMPQSLESWNDKYVSWLDSTFYEGKLKQFQMKGADRHQ